MSLKTLLKAAFASIAVLLLAAQFVRPARTNPAVSESRAVESHLSVTPQVASILERSCNDCHSNKTEWPWYSRVAPASWLVVDHVDHGRRELNFSEWSRFSREDMPHALAAVCKEVRSGSMPMASYTLLHRDARLTPEDVRTLCDWTAAESQRLRGATGAARASR
ncbi:MAG TPA: heme-binding domain-containing protein [Pyrinomonadaceae bacterium]|nr:heme-binding domain-containing protein [Pyrinomonadaceae bacterium]